MAASAPQFERVVALILLCAGQDASTPLVPNRTPSLRSHVGFPCLTFWVHTQVVGNSFIVLHYVSARSELTTCRRLSAKLKLEFHNMPYPRRLGLAESLRRSVQFFSQRDAYPPGLLLHCNVASTNLDTAVVASVRTNTMAWSLEIIQSSSKCHARLQTILLLQ